MLTSFSYSVIFVHGYGGHPYLTWMKEVWPDATSNQNPKGFRESTRSVLNRKANLGIPDPLKVFWPLDLLKKDFPRCQIWTYGYDRESLNERSDETSALLTDLRKIHFQRDLIFITHDLGGLLVKNALLKAWFPRDSANQSIKRHVKGIIFFGTPHQILDSGTFYNILQKLLLTTGAGDGASVWDFDSVNSCSERFSKFVIDPGLQILNIQEEIATQLDYPYNTSSLV